MSTEHVLVLATLLGLGMTSSVFAAETGSGSVNFKGQIITAACNVTVDGSKDSTVDLGQWPTSTFKTTGDKTIPQPFTLNVDDCTDGSFKFNFTGTSDSNNSNLLQVSKATGVGIAIANADSITNTIQINTNAGAESNANLVIAKDAKSGSLPLQAYYQSTQSTVTAGEANATVRVTLQQK